MAANSTSTGIAVLVVGSGRFGKNYPTVLAGINREDAPNLPIVDRLVITSTDQQRADDRAAALASLHGRHIPSITGAAITDERQLTVLLQDIRPDLICIAARDPVLGDAIHARYTEAALPYGRVLCEKPFTPADGGKGLTLLQKLAAHYPPDRFGLELPMAVVARAMAAGPNLGTRLNSARHIQFLWQRPEPATTPLIPDLVLHPWSLLPEGHRSRVERVREAQRTAEIALTITCPDGRPPLPCDIRLQSGGSQRRMTLDDFTMEFEFKEGAMEIRELGRKDAPPLLIVANPLRLHIEAMLQGKPVVGFDRAVAAQELLEAVDAA